MKVRGTQSSWLPPPVTPPLPSPPPRILLCFGARAGSPRHETAARLRACRTVEARGCYRRKFAPRGRSATWERLQHKPVHSSYGFQRTGSDETRVLPRSSRTHECDIVDFCREPRVTRVYSRVVSCGTGNAG
uniref:uncharacterized protein LOC117160284 isoform X3 n=1 Tax=Bombus vancouverensis nearcticus TaxID=2705178 RepID=UPI001438F284|nr:uncharacterized protein LOC117160284 isoform X3 [Bombus vancouverensis nearcticus]